MSPYYHELGRGSRDSDGTEEMAQFRELALTSVVHCRPGDSPPITNRANCSSEFRTSIDFAEYGWIYRLIREPPNADGGLF